MTRNFVPLIAETNNHTKVERESPRLKENGLYNLVSIKEEEKIDKSSSLKR